MNILSATKKHAISRGRLGCLGDVATVNLIRGCAGNCVFCYARCLSGAPEPGRLAVYFDLPAQLRQSLDRRRRPPPSFVLFCTASDPFLGGETIVQLSRNCLDLLVTRKIGIHLATRGDIPDDVIELLAAHGPHVRVTVPLVSMSTEYTRRWEPGAISPRQRLFLIQRLQRAEIAVTVRVDPLIPFVNDHTEQIRELVSALAGIGLKSATLSFLHLRPGVSEQIQEEAPPELSQLALGAFALEPHELAAAKFHHLPMKLRIAGLRRIQRIAREAGLKASACHCQNPGIPAGRCPVAPPVLPTPMGEQMALIDE
jgi:DNA repair photolyase